MQQVTVGATPVSTFEPEGTPRGAVVVVQEAFGVNEHILDVAGRFAAAGWFTVVPHLFHRTGDPALGYDDFSQVMPHMGALKADEILDDVDAALSVVADAGFAPAQTGIVGFCMGGNVATCVAVRRPIGAAISFYGGGVEQARFGFRPLVEEAPELGAPWLGLYGDLDQSIPVDQVERLRTAAVASRSPTWSATPMPATASTATAGPTSSPPALPTPGPAPSPSSPSTWPHPRPDPPPPPPGSSSRSMPPLSPDRVT